MARNAARRSSSEAALRWLEMPLRLVGIGRTPRTGRRRASRTRISFAYRAMELLLLGAAVCLAWLGVASFCVAEGSPWLLVVALGGAAVASALVLVPLERMRAGASRLERHLLNVAIVVAVLIAAMRLPLAPALDALNDVVAGERATEVRVIRHQVYAAYRRMNLEAERKILERAEVFAPTIDDAARAFHLDPELLVGIAAAESSFYPRDSRDGGRGLFQVTAVPPAALQAARVALGANELDPLNQRHNAFVAAATLATYREQMNGDLFLTLLAYNIGPKNGGLATVMKQYGAHNFAQVQPYLQNAPRDYPVRVLAGALAYRVWTRLHALPRFEEGDWARQIQRLGIPGLDSEPGLVAERTTLDAAAR